MRKLFHNSKKFGSSHFNASTAYRNYTSQPLNSLGTKSINCNRVRSRSQPLLLRRVSTQTDLTKNAKVITALQFVLNTSLVLLVRDTASLAKTVCVQIVLAINTTNRHVRQLNDAKYAVDSIIQHCMTQQNKSNFQQQLFQQKTHKNISLLFRQTTRQRLKIRSIILRQKACRIRIQAAATGNPSTVKTKPTLKNET